MGNKFYTNYSEKRFIDKLKENIDHCKSFCFSVSFIKKPGLRLLAPNIDAALARGAVGRLITSTYQNFTDIDSLTYFLDLQTRYPGSFSCHLDRDCFYDNSGNAVGFHSKGYLFEFDDHNEFLIGSSNITVFALIKNIEWDISVIDGPEDNSFPEAMEEFNRLWDRTKPLSRDLIDEYKTRLYYSIERWDMDYSVANAEVKPNYMQRRALKELSRIRVMGVTKALVCSAAGSGKTYLAAFDVLNFGAKRMLYVVHEGSILMKSFETFQTVMGGERSFGVFNADFKDFDADFVFSTNVSMANSLELFDRHAFDYVIIDECHHSTAGTYKKIIEYFEPEFLLGITATPERMDEEDVFGLFDHNMPYELRLRDAIINGLVVPFHYFGIHDKYIKYGIEATKGHKFIEQFSNVEHCDFIFKSIESHRIKEQKLKALAFCRDVSHASSMALAMSDYYHTQYLTGRNPIGERIKAYKDLQDDSADLEVLFTVDILNEGVDIPGVNMVLFLRPTESQTVFIQQLGRGLRTYEGKEYVTVLDFIGNDYTRSVQIAFALGSLSQNFVAEKNLVSALIKDDFRSVGLESYGVEIHIDELSKKEVLSYIDSFKFNTKSLLEQDYRNFKKFIMCQEYPKHVDYLNNDFAPDLIRFMQAKIYGKKNNKTSSYYRFLSAIGEEHLPVFDEKQDALVRYVSEMLPIVRPYEYLIIQKLITSSGDATTNEILDYVKINYPGCKIDVFNHAIKYMKNSTFFGKKDDHFFINNVTINDVLHDYLSDLIEFGLGKYDIDFADADKNETFHLWMTYRKEQVMQLLLKNPRDKMRGTKNFDGIVYAFVKIIKGKSVSESLKYADGYIDNKTFQWETEAKISEKNLEDLKNSIRIELFVRKTDEEDNITLPFTYIGSGKMEFIEGSRKPNGAYLFRVPMKNEAPEDIFFDFKLR